MSPIKFDPDAQTLDELRRENVQLKSLIDVSQDMIYRMSLPSGQYEYVSRACVKIFGYEPEEFYESPKLIEKILHPDWRVYFENARKDFLNGNIQPTYEYQIVHKTGLSRWIRQNNSLIRNNMGEIEAITGVISDITEQRLTKNELMDKKSHMQSLMESAVDFVVYRLAADDSIPEGGKVVFVSPSIKEVMGVSDPYRFETWFENIHPDDATRVRDNNRLARQTFSVFDEIMRVYHTAKKEWRWIRAMSTPIVSSLDSVVYYNGLIVNITDIKQAEETAKSIETRFTEMAERIDEVFWVFDWKCQCFDYASPAYEQIWGRSVADLYEQYDEWADSIHQDDRAYAKSSFEALLKTGGEESRQYRIVRPDGNIRWISDRAFAINDSEGEMIRIVGIAKDITAQKAAETSLKTSEANYRQLFEAEPDAIILVDGDTGQILDANKSAIQLYGYNRDEMIGLQALTLSAEPKNSTIHIQKMLDTIDSPEKRHQLARRMHRKKDGTVFPVEIATGFFDRDEKKMVCGIFRDISERQRYEDALEENNRFIQQIIYQAADGIFVTDTDDRFIVWNRRMEEISGMSAASVIGEHYLELFPSLLEQGVWPLYQQAKMGEPVSSKDYRYQISKEGGTGWAISNYAPMRNGDGKITGVIGILHETTYRKEAEASVAAERERLAVTLQSIGDAVITTDINGNITLINPVAEELTGWTKADALGRDLLDVFRIINEVNRESCENPVELVIESGHVVGLANNTILLDKNGDEHIIADSGAPIFDAQKQIIGVVLVFRDITESRRLEAEMLKMEKLESIGVLAGGIAHDFNNFLVGIVGNLSLIKLDIEPCHKLYPTLESMEKAAKRAQNLTQQLLTFSKGGAPVKRVVELTSLLKEAALFALRGSNVKCNFDFSSDAFYCNVDEGQLSQVIHNLILNADQAMPMGGLIHISAKEVLLDLYNQLSLREGKYIKLKIRDEGIGVKPEHAKKLFDPYFTTKQKGSGLGLTIAYSIINKHNGLISVDSEVGVSTTFTIYLPLSKETQGLSGNKTKPLIESGGRVLIMDDDEIVIDIVSRMVEKMGMSAVLATDGEEAVHMYRKAMDVGDPFDVVILDLTIPGGMGGNEAIQRLRKIDPQVKAIVSSGYSIDQVMSQPEKYGFRAAVQKPYLMQDLNRAIKIALE